MTSPSSSGTSGSCTTLAAGEVGSRQWPTVVAFVVLAFIPAILGGGNNRPGDWYRELQKPEFNPPSWVFGPVWTVLYLTIGAAGAMAWRAAIPAQRWLAFSIYGVQLVCNGLWSWLFFGLRSPFLAFLDIIALLVSIVANIVVFARIRTAAGLVLIPYLLWVSFATVLNWAIWRLNQ